jgi:hypothetical protein
MMLARFVLQDCSQTSSQHAVSAVTPQRAIINIPVQAVCYTNELAAGVQNSCDTLFDDAGKIWCWDCSQTSSQHAVSRL